MSRRYAGAFQAVRQERGVGDARATRLPARRARRAAARHRRFRDAVRSFLWQFES